MKAPRTDTIFVGMQPSKAKFRKNCALDRFALWMDELDISMVTFQNAITDPDLPQKVTSADFKMLYNCIKGYGKVVALGALVSQILTAMGVQHFKMPHPSPRNRLLNDKSYETNILKQLKEYLDDQYGDTGSWGGDETASSVKLHIKGNGSRQRQALHRLHSGASQSVG